VTRRHVSALVVVSILLASMGTTSAQDAVDLSEVLSFRVADDRGEVSALEHGVVEPDHSILILWDEEVLRAMLAGEAVDAEPEPMALAEAARLATLRDLVDAFFEAQAALVRARAAGPATRSEAARLANDAFGRAGLRAISMAEAHEEALAASGAVAEAEAFRGTLNALVLEASYEPLARAMQREIAELNARVARALEDAPRYRVQMRATLVGLLGSRRLHLDGYDTLQTYAPRETPRFHFGLDERARREVEAADELAQVVRDALSGELKRKLKDAMDALERELDVLREAIEADVLEGNVREALDAMRASGDARFGPAIESGETLVATLEALTLDVPPFEAQTDAELLLGIYDALSSQIGGLVAQIGTLEGQVRGFVDDVETVAEAVPGAVEADALAALRASWERVQANPRIAAVVETYRTVRRSLGLSVDVARASLADERPRTLDEDLDTRLDLLIATPDRRHSGDALYVEALVTRGEDDDPRIVARTFRKVRLLHLGLRGEVRGALIFSDPQKNAYADQDWEPTPALGYQVHYGKGRSRFWNDVLDPGLGLALTTLDYQDEDDFELGIAANVTLFRSLLWAGYGRNLQAESDFFFVGVNPLAIGRLFREGVGAPRGGGL
jgi:hypothetical protein